MIEATGADSRHKFAGPNLPLLVAVATWAVNFVALKTLYAHMSPAAMSALRFVIMWLGLAALCWWRKEPISLPPAIRWRAYVQGALSMGLYMILFLEGLSKIRGSECATLLSTGPIWTTLIAMAVRQERFRPMAIVGAVVAFVGVSGVIFGAHASAAASPGVLADRALGITMTLASAIVWASSTVLSRPLLDHVSPLRLLTASMPAGLVFLAPYGLGPALRVDYAALTGLDWAIIAHVSLLAGVAGFIGFYAGVRQIGAGRAMLYQYFVPPSAAALEWLIFGKSLTLIQFGSLLVVVSGVALATRTLGSRPITAPEG